MTGDADQLRQVLANLLRNALVHTPAGTPIEVSVDRDNGAVRLEVRDHGPGLPTDDADALFERFWRAEGGRERGKDGAGLGLAIVAGIVDGHAGSVRAANAPGGGAAFEVRLPARNLDARRGLSIADPATQWIFARVPAHVRVHRFRDRAFRETDHLPRPGAGTRAR